MTAFLDFKVPEDIPLWELGRKETRKRLEEILKPLTKKKDAIVQSVKAEIKLADIRMSFDRSLSYDEVEGNVGIFFWILFDGDSAEILKTSLLTLVIHPDLGDEQDQWRPLHLCSHRG